MKFDLHLHTRRSRDSFARPQDIVETAVRRRLSGIAITDHEECATAEIEEAASRKGIWLIKGIEVNTELGDIVGLFVDAVSVRRADAEWVIGEIHDRGGLAVLVHPFKYIRHYPDRILEKVDAVEIRNGRWADLEAFRDPRVDRLLAAVRGRTAGSDAHFAFEVGRVCWNTMELTGPSDLRESILCGEGFASGDLSSPWLDEFSQYVKLAKNPTGKQFVRAGYRTLKKAILGGRRRI